LAIYPSNPNLPQGTNNTPVNPDNWNSLVNNINAIGLDLVDGRSDNQTFPGIPHTAGQSNDIGDMLNAIRHMIVTISGETNWYNDTGASLKSHDHSSGKGGVIPWSSIGINNRVIEMYPSYPGGVWTPSLHGGPPSGSNNLIRNTGQDVVSNIARNYYEVISSEATIQDYYIGLRFAIPENFGVWATNNAIQVEYRTANESSANCGVDLVIYKSGNSNIITSSANNVSLNWSNINIPNSALGSWVPGDIVELYLKLKTRNNYYTRIGKIRFNFIS